MTCGKVARSIASLRFKEALEIILTSLDYKHDAFDTYAEISEAALTAGVEQLVFSAWKPYHVRI